MMRPSQVLPWIIAGALGLVALGQCGDGPEPMIDERTARQLEALRADSARFAAERDSLAGVARRAVQDAAESERQAATAQASARRQGVRASRAADEARRATTAADSADAWRLAYEARTLEADSLAAANAALAETVRLERIARVALASDTARLVTRLARVEASHAHLERLLRDAERPCRIIGPVPCPSRTVAAAAGAIATAVVIVAIGR